MSNRKGRVDEVTERAIPAQGAASEETVSLRARFKEAILRTEFGFRLFLKFRQGVEKPRGYPQAPWENAVLKTRSEWEAAVSQAESLGLPSHQDLPKNWDSLAALHRILRATDRRGQILDAGAEFYSQILIWLYLYGYENLIGLNLAFDRSIKRGPIRYEYGDITSTRCGDGTFDAISCLSVIEHGVNLGAYFQEMARILKRGGMLITSTDYWEEGVDTKGATAYGVPVHVFSRREVIAALELAEKFDLKPISPIDLKCHEKAVTWGKFSLDYTFLIFTLVKA